MPENAKNEEGTLILDCSESAIRAALRGRRTFCRFLTANDTGLTGGHQAGIYIAKSGSEILFDTPGQKGENKDRRVRITWQNDIVTDTRFIYYGQGTRNEYRITSFGKGFPYLHTEYTGALFVLIQEALDEYQAFILNTDDEIDRFLDAFGMTPADTNQMIDTIPLSENELEEEEFARFVYSLVQRFPSTTEMSAKARDIENFVYDHRALVKEDPDQKLLDWTNVEYRLFKAVEYSMYGERVKEGFASVDEFVNLANEVMNRRKSRAGKGLEHHLAALFDANGILYDSQTITEGHKKPDFLFPSGQDYHDLSFPTDKLITLAAKTTCKDRWRQILNEADRLRDRNKYLCTMQQGISSAQMDEMQAEGVVLVVPRKYIAAYPKDRQSRIWTIGRFISFIRETEGLT